jgi:hypothetical protein
VTQDFFSETIVRKTGHDLARAGQHAREQSLIHGMRMAALAGNVWPMADGGLLEKVSEELIVELIAFSVNTRRLMEMLKAKKGSITADGPLFDIRTGEYPIEKDVWTAVNRVLHASQLNVTTVHVPTKKHVNLGDQIVANVVITSPERTEVCVCPQGLFYAIANDPTQWKISK